MADVIRIIPKPEVLEANPVYAEFIEFYKSAPLYDIVCGKKGAYREITELAGMEWGQPWPDELVKELRSAYWHFSKVRRELSGDAGGIEMGDAFLV
jgi:hypothetical protein